MKILRRKSQTQVLNWPEGVHALGAAADSSIDASPVVTKAEQVNAQLREQLEGDDFIELVSRVITQGTQIAS